MGISRGKNALLPYEAQHNIIAENCKICFCNKMAADSFRTLERQILAEISAKDREISFLKAERAALERVLFSARKRELANREVTRSNSIGRIMAENAILDRLDENPRSSVNVKLLEAAARAAVPGMGQSTFRSHLHRLKERGLIEASERGLWRRTARRSTFSVGDLVRHKDFGVGSVVAVHGPELSRSNVWKYDIEWADENDDMESHTDAALKIVHRVDESR